MVYRSDALIWEPAGKDSFAMANERIAVLLHCHHCTDIAHNNVFAQAVSKFACFHDSDYMVRILIKGIVKVMLVNISNSLYEKDVMVA